MGGYHVTYLVEEALDHCDVVVRGEGEATFAEVANELLDGNGTLDRVLGISVRRHGVIVSNSDRPLIENIDLIPDQGLIEGYADYHRRWIHKLFPILWTVNDLHSVRAAEYVLTPCSHCR